MLYLSQPLKLLHILLPQSSEIHQLKEEVPAFRTAVIRTWSNRHHNINSLSTGKLKKRQRKNKIDKQFYISVLVGFVCIELQKHLEKSQSVVE